MAQKVIGYVKLQIPAGKVVGVLGKNGSGKSTLFKLANDLLTATSGQVLVDGQAVGVVTKQIVSYLPERTYLEPGLRVSDVIKIFATFYTDFDQEKAEKLLIDLQLDKNMRLAKMSKGMKEKVQLVMVMSRRAKLYILDEPLGGVDPASRDYILQTILQNFTPRFKSKEEFLAFQDSLWCKMHLKPPSYRLCTFPGLRP